MPWSLLRILEVFSLMGDVQERIARLEKQLADLQRRLPAHSVPPSMILEMERIEEELAQARAQLETDASSCN